MQARVQVVAAVAIGGDIGKSAGSAASQMGHEAGRSCHDLSFCVAIKICLVRNLDWPDSRRWSDLAKRFPSCVFAQKNHAGRFLLLKYVSS